VKVQITLLEEMLGTCSSDRDVHEKYIASKAPDAMSTEEEVAAIGVEATVEKGMTIFARENDKPFIWNYMIKGFFKAAASAMNRVAGSETKKLSSIRKIIDTSIAVTPRKIFLGDVVMGNCQRPLRIEFPEKVALANSETIPAGTSFVIEIAMLNPVWEKAVREWLNMGETYFGLGQWRNSGKGMFSWKEVK